MIRTLMAVSLLQLSISAATSNGAEPDSYRTDWLTPPVKISDELQHVCAMDLAVANQDSDRWTGTITLYFGQPVFDQFGDADRKSFETRKFPVTLSKLTAPPKRAWFGPPSEASSVLYELTGESSLACIQVVLDTEQPGNCRVLVIGPERRIVRVLPLQSELLQRQAERHPRSSPSELGLLSDLFIGREDRFNRIRISGVGGKLRFEHDRNHYTLDHLGNTESTTLILFMPRNCSLREMHVPDVTGQERRLFKCDLSSANNFSRPDANRIPTEFDDAFLVLHPHEGGWHRLLLQRAGRIDRVLPMYSRRLQSWLRIKSQLTDATEQRVFERISQKIPYFNHLTIENQHVRKARFYVAADNEAVLDHLAEFPHLNDLEITGDLLVGKPLERFTNLEHLRFSHGRVTAEVLQHVGRLSHLKSLNFYTVRMDCRGLQHLSGLRELTQFEYVQGDYGTFAENYDDSCVSVFSKLGELQDMTLIALPLTEAAVAQLPTSERLANIAFGDSVPIRAVLKYSQAVPAARIELGGGRWWLADGEVSLPQSVTNEDLGELRTMEKVRSLSLSDADSVSDDGLAHLRSLKLTKLDMKHLRNVTDADMAHVASIETLESLNLWYCRKLTNNAIAELKRLPNLRKITLFGTQIDPSAFQSAMPNCEIVR